MELTNADIVVFNQKNQPISIFQVSCLFDSTYLTPCLRTKFEVNRLRAEIENKELPTTSCEIYWLVVTLVLLTI